MKVHVYGVSWGEVNGYRYGKIHTLAPIEANGIGKKCDALKCTAEIAMGVSDVDCDYNVEFNQYGKVISLRKVS